jgi:hypothetical protein
MPDDNYAVTITPFRTDLTLGAHSMTERTYPLAEPPAVGGATLAPGSRAAGSAPA